jgi:hypothetical protein
MPGMIDEDNDDPCCGCNCQDDDECQNCYDKILTELAREENIDDK